MMRRQSFLLLTLVTLIGCGESAEAPRSDERCDLCGMRIEATSEWRAGGASADGEELHFDAPKCLFRYHLTRGGVQRPWVIEHYSQEHADAEALLYVTGTELYSPMGSDLVPVRGREAAEGLRIDHHGDAIHTFGEVTEPVIEPLFRADE